MIPILLFAGIAFVAGVALAAFWKDLIPWLKKAAEKVSEVIKKLASAILVGVKVYIQKTNGIIKRVAKYYSQDKETKRWSEHVATQEISEDEVPEDIRRMGDISAAPIDISDKVEKQMLTLQN